MESQHKMYIRRVSAEEEVENHNYKDGGLYPSLSYIIMLGSSRRESRKNLIKQSALWKRYINFIVCFPDGIKNHARPLYTPVTQTSGQLSEQVLVSQPDNQLRKHTIVMLRFELVIF